MKNKYSLISLIAVGLFMISIFVTSKFQSGFGQADKFGFPFVFFSAENVGEMVENKNFTPEFLLVDFAIYFAIAYAVVSLIAMLKVERNNKITNNHLAHN